MVQLSQKHYMEKIFERFSKITCKEVSMLIVTENNIKDSQTNTEYTYRKAVGMLMYLIRHSLCSCYCGF